MVSPRRIELMARNFPHNVAVLGKEIPLRRKNIPPRAIQLRKEMPLVGTELTASDRDGTTWGGVRRLRGPWSCGPPQLSGERIRYRGSATANGIIGFLPSIIWNNQRCQTHTTTSEGFQIMTHRQEGPPLSRTRYRDGMLENVKAPLEGHSM